MLCPGPRISRRSRGGDTTRYSCQILGFLSIPIYTPLAQAGPGDMRHLSRQLYGARNHQAAAVPGGPAEALELWACVSCTLLPPTLTGVALTDIEILHRQMAYWYFWNLPIL
jgi:hypothetical protein